MLFNIFDFLGFRLFAVFCFFRFLFLGFFLFRLFLFRFFLFFFLFLFFLSLLLFVLLAVFILFFATGLGLRGFGPVCGARGAACDRGFDRLVIGDHSEGLSVFRLIARHGLFVQRRVVLLELPHERGVAG